VRKADNAIKFAVFETEHRDSAHNKSTTSDGRPFSFYLMALRNCGHRRVQAFVH
jgi:hypothetical protein